MISDNLMAIFLAIWFIPIATYACVWGASTLLEVILSNTWFKGNLESKFYNFRWKHGRKIFHSFSILTATTLILYSAYYTLFHAKIAFFEHILIGIFVAPIIFIIFWAIGGILVYPLAILSIIFNGNPFKKYIEKITNDEFVGIMLVLSLALTFVVAIFATRYIVCCI